MGDRFASERDFIQTGLDIIHARTPIEQKRKEDEIRLNLKEKWQHTEKFLIRLNELNEQGLLRLSHVVSK